MGARNALKSRGTPLVQSALRVTELLEGSSASLQVPWLRRMNTGDQGVLSAWTTNSLGATHAEDPGSSGLTPQGHPPTGAKGPSKSTRQSLGGTSTPTVGALGGTGATIAEPQSASGVALQGSVIGQLAKSIRSTGGAWQGGVDTSGYHLQGGPSSMSAAVLWEPNGPLVLEQLRLPRPQAEEVLIQTRACGVCHTDLHVMKAEVPFPMPCVLGHEVSGRVLEHGPNTSQATRNRLPVGSRVVAAFIMPCGGCFFCAKGKEDLCESFFSFNRGKGLLYDGTTRLHRASDGKPILMYSMGGLAQYCAVPASAVVPLPDSLPLAQSAIIGCALFTAYGAVRNAGDVRAGESVAVIGTGGVGTSCVQVARAFGAGPIIAVDIAEDKLRKSVELGASHTINAAGLTKAEVSLAVRELTGGRGVDVAIEALGRPQTFETAVECVRDGGRAVMIGIAPVGVSASVDITRIVRRNITIIGSYGARARMDLPTLVGLAERGQLNVAGAVQSRHPLEAASEVYAALDQGRIVGRAIIDMSAA